MEPSRNFVLFIVFLAAFIALVAAVPEEDEKDWESFKRKHSKKYQSAEHERNGRNLWRKRRIYVKKHNDEYKRGIHTFEMEDNHLSDLTDEEIDALKGVKLPRQILEKSSEVQSCTTVQTRQGQLAYSYVDLRTHYCMPPIKNQLKCGSCYAHAAVHPIEFLFCNATEIPISLSEQQIVDCSTAAPYSNKGCNGGWYVNTWNYIKNAWLALASTYPYVNAATTCMLYAPKAVTVKSWVQLPSLDEFAMADAVASHGPLAIAMNCTRNFDLYKSGIFQDPSCSPSSIGVNHGMNIVGYGTDYTTGLDYWITRNSWGVTWGSSGYVFVRRGANMCNIARYAAYPVL